MGKLILNLFTFKKLLGLAFAVLFLILTGEFSGVSLAQTVSPPSFPACPDKIFTERGDRASYDFGIHGIPGVGNLVGRDDVYTLSDGNFLQCFCPPEGSGDTGWQTNWWDIDIANLTEEQINQFISEGWLLEVNGLDWNLLDDRYLAKNSNFSCLRPSPPLSQASPPICTAPSVTTAPLYSIGNLERVDNDTIKISWVVTDGHAQKYGIHYGTDPNNLQWYTEVSGHETREAVINLVPYKNIYFNVCSIGTCGDAVCGVTLPQVLGAATELPVTGFTVLGVITIIPLGYYLYRRFRLV